MQFQPHVTVNTSHHPQEPTNHLLVFPVQLVNNHQAVLLLYQLQKLVIPHLLKSHPHQVKYLLPKSHPHLLQNHLHRVRHLLLKSRHLLKVRRHLLIPQLKLLLVNHQLHHHHLLRPLLLPSLQLRNHHHLLRDLHLHKNHPQVKNHLLKNHHLLPKNHLLPKVHLPLKSHHLLKVHRHLLILQQILPQLLQQMNKAVLVLVNHPLKTNQLTLLSLILPVQPILVLLQTVVLLTPIPIVNPQTLLLQQIPALLIVILLQVPKLTQM